MCDIQKLCEALAAADAAYHESDEVQKLLARLDAADALAIAGEKAENAMEALLDDIQMEGFCSVTFKEYREGAAYGDMILGTARAALQELSAALRQYQETKK